MYSHIKKVHNKTKIIMSNITGDAETEAAISAGVLIYWSAVESILKPHALYNSRSVMVKKVIRNISSIE